MKDNEFIKGKWYVSTNDVFHPKESKLYIKFSMIRKDNIHYSECIQTWSDSPYRNYAEFANPYLNFVLADMTEVSKFLPKEHVDKITTYEFEADKWYELKYLYGKRECNTLMKSTSNSTNRLNFTEYYDIIDKEWRSAVSFEIDKDITMTYVKELSLEDVQQYLPENHPDLVVGLPKEYIVECNSSEETTAIIQYTSNDKDSWSHWKYVVHSPILYPSTLGNNNIVIKIFDSCVHLPILTFENWNKLKNMKEEFKLPEKWCIKADGENGIAGEYFNSQSNSTCYTFNTGYYHNYNLYIPKQIITIKGDLKSSFHCNDIREGYTEITLEQFKKYVMKDKKIIEWRLKENCKQYAEAAFQLSGLIGTFQVCGHHIHSGIGNTSFTADTLRKNNVLDLWFEPVYEEEFINLSFGDTRVTVTKGQGFVSLQEGNISKTELKAIIDHFTKGPKILGYEGKAEKVTYGCKSGLISELQTIYNTI